MSSNLLLRPSTTSEVFPLNDPSGKQANKRFGSLVDQESSKLQALKAQRASNIDKVYGLNSNRHNIDTDTTKNSTAVGHIVIIKANFISLFITATTKSFFFCHHI